MLPYRALLSLLPLLGPALALPVDPPAAPLAAPPSVPPLETASPHCQVPGPGQTFTPAQVCTVLQACIGAGQVFLPGTSQYVSQTTSLSATAIQQPAVCVVEPRSSNEVASIIQLIGASRTPFAIRNGGHNYNPGFSATSGVLVSMFNFNKTTINYGAGTIDVEAGLRFSDVYTKLAGTGLGVNGGRLVGPGVSGVTLGGGYAWTSNEQGLTIDKVVSFQMVTPDGQKKFVSATSQPDLFWAVRGGMNKFGVITSWTFKTYAQGNICGGQVNFGGDGNTTLINQVVAAFETWQATHTDPKANMDIAYIVPGQGGPLLSANLFYNGPVTPPGTFDVFFNLPSLSNTYESNMPFLKMLTDKIGVIPPAPASISSTVPVKSYPASYFAKMIASANYISAAAAAAGKPLFAVVYRAEPFLPSFYNKKTSGDSAYPHSVSNPVTPMSLILNWGNPADTSFFTAQASNATTVLYNAAIAQGLSTADAPFYPNYAALFTPPSQLYRGNLARLTQIQNAVDPRGVMDLTGGFAI